MMVSVGESSSGMLLPIEGGLVQVPPPYTQSKGMARALAHTQGPRAFKSCKGVKGRKFVAVRLPLSETVGIRFNAITAISCACKTPVSETK